MELMKGVILGIRVFACFIALLGIQAVLGDYYEILKGDIATSSKMADALIADATPTEIRKIEEERAKRRGESTIKQLIAKPSIGMIATGVLLFAVARPLARALCGEQNENKEPKNST